MASLIWAVHVLPKTAVSLAGCGFPHWNRQFAGVSEASPPVDVDYKHHISCTMQALGAVTCSSPPLECSQAVQLWPGDIESMLLMIHTWLQHCGVAFLGCGEGIYWWFTVLWVHSKKSEREILPVICSSDWLSLVICTNALHTKRWSGFYYLAECRWALLIFSVCLLICHHAAYTGNLHNTRACVCFCGSYCRAGYSPHPITNEWLNRTCSPFPLYFFCLRISPYCIVTK